MALLDRLRLLIGQRAPDLPCRASGEKAAAHPDAEMDPPAVDRQAPLGDRALPGEDVCVDRVDERAVEIEDEPRWARAKAKAKTLSAQPQPFFQGSR